MPKNVHIAVRALRGGKPWGAAARREGPHRGAREERGVHVSAARGRAVAGARRFRRAGGRTHAHAAARGPRAETAVLAGDSGAREPDFRDPERQGTADRPHQHHRAGVGAFQSRRGRCGRRAAPHLGGDSRFAQGAQPRLQSLVRRTAPGGGLCGVAPGAGHGDGRRGLREPLFRQL